MSIVSPSILHDRIEALEQLPPVPAILFPLLSQLDECNSESDLQNIVHLVSHDSALATQVIHMANSPLFGICGRISSLREAAVALGITRLRDIVTSCCLVQISPRSTGPFDVAAFWEHSLACTLISRSLARKLDYDPERAYLAGLLHDLGILVNVLLMQKEFSRVFQNATQTRRPLRDVEIEHIGFSHEVTGDILSVRWQLFDYLGEAMRCHHDVSLSTLDPTLCSIVRISDVICRTSGLGYGYEENLDFNLQEELAWKILSRQTPSMQPHELAGFTASVESYVKEVRTLISALFRA